MPSYADKWVEELRRIRRSETLACEKIAKKSVPNKPIKSTLVIRWEDECVCFVCSGSGTDPETGDDCRECGGIGFYRSEFCRKGVDYV